MFSLPHIFLFGCCRNALYTEILWFACRYDFSPAHCFCVLSVWKAARKSRPSSLTVLEFAWMSPQTTLTARSVGWLSASSLCMFACQSAFAFFHISTCPFTFLSSRVCLPTGWIFSATHRAQPLRKTNTSLSLLSSLLQVSPGVSFHKANNVRLHSKLPFLPPLHSRLPLVPLCCVKEPTITQHKPTVTIVGATLSSLTTVFFHLHIPMPTRQ